MDNFNGKRNKKIKILSSILIGISILIFCFYVFRIGENPFKGLLTIITSPAVLITDFLVIGGIGGSFLNATIIFLFNLYLVKTLDIPINGIVIASFFTVFGFSFFGKNILNILPIYVGGILYSKYSHIDFKEILITIFFTSALAPFISEIAFRVDSTNYEFAYVNGVILGVVIGFIITPLAKKMVSFHEGYNLYNLGFTGGILGAIITSILKAYQFNITPQRIISTEFDIALKILCCITFSLLIIIGYYINDRSFKGFMTLIKDTGWRADFTIKYGYGLTFINMGIMGFVAVSYVMLLGQTLNGPLLAGILTIVGFSAHGKHIFNTIPILCGVFLAKFGSTNDNFTVALSALFGTSLAPISGAFGSIWGIIAGWLHFSVVRSIGIIHGGMNLYNNGFSAGIVAGFLLPIIDIFSNQSSQRHINFLKRRKELYNAIIQDRNQSNFDEVYYD